METKKAEVRLESVNIKRKKVTGHAFKSRIKRLRRKKAVTELEWLDSKRIDPEPMVNTLKDNFVDGCSDGSGLDNSTGLRSRVNLDDCERLSTSSLSKNKDAPEPESSPCLGRVQDGVLNSECSENDAHPKETLLAMDENDLLVTCVACSKKNSSSNVSQEKEFCFCNATVDMELDGSSASKKFTSKDEAAESEVNISVKIKRKCDKRMKKLILKQQQETQKLHQVWEEEKLNLEKDHRLEAAVIRKIYGEGSLRAEKLHLLDCNFEKKMEENNLLTEAQLQDLETRQLAARNVEKQKAACWLAEARSNGYSEQTAVSGDLPLPSQSDKDLSTEVPKVVDYVNAEDLRNTSDNGDTIACPDQLMDQRVGTDATHIVDSPLAAQILEPSEKVSPNHGDLLPQPVAEGQIHAVLVSKNAKDRNAPVPESCCLQTRVANSELVDTVAPVQSHVEEHTSENYEQVNLLSFDAESDAPVPEGCSSQIQVADNPGGVDAPVLEHHNLAIEVVDSEVDTVVPVQSHIEAQTTENCEQSHPASIDASPNANLSPDTDVMNQGHDSERNLFQTAHESSQAEGVLERQNNHIDVTSGPEQIPENLESTDRQDRDAPIQEDQGTAQIEAASSELVTIVPSHSEAQPIENCEQLHSVSPSCNPTPATEVEQQIHNSVGNSTEVAQAVEDLSHMEESAYQIELDLEMRRNYPDIDILSRVIHDSGAESTTTFPTNMPMLQAAANTDARNFHGSSTLFLHPNSPILSANPFETELLKLIQESQHLDQSCKDTVSHLNSECEKETQDVVAQIQSKYETRLKAAEADFRLKKSEIHKKQNKVFVNKVLAEAFSSTYPSLQPAGVAGILHGNPTGSMQQLHQQLSQLPTQSSACQPPSNLCVSTPNLHTTQHPLAPHSTSRITGSNTTAPPVQVAYQPVALSRPSSSRPPVISNFNPAGSRHTAGQIIRGRAHAPHLQAGASSTWPATLPMISRPPHMAPQLSRPWLVSLPYQNHDRPTEPPPPPLPLPEISMTFGTLDSSYLETLSNVHAGNSNNVATSEVLLIDDD